MHCPKQSLSKALDSLFFRHERLESVDANFPLNLLLLGDVIQSQQQIGVDFFLKKVIQTRVPKAEPCPVTRKPARTKAASPIIAEFPVAES